MSIALVVGARPNFMKIAPIEREFSSRGVETLLIHTGQHYDHNMSDVFFEDLNMRTPDIHLNVGSASHAVQTAKIMISFEEVCNEHKPEMVLVVGDVNSTIACTLVAKKMGIPVTHVEAGLRSFDMEMPEEINRILTDSVSDLLLTPSRDGDENLRKEGVEEERIKFVGNIMIDSLFDAVKRTEVRAFDIGVELPTSGYGVITLHRPSNVDEPEVLKNLVEVISELSEEIEMIFPAHPRTKIRLDNNGLTTILDDNPRIHLIEPLGYLDFVTLISKSSIVLTDSGGLQEETTALGIPCLTIRENTERPITITEGTNQLVGINPEMIRQGFANAFQSKGDADQPCPEYWDGKTASRIADAVLGFLSR